MTELALLAVVLVEAAQFSRVFQGQRWSAPVLLTAVAVVLAVALGRRLRLPWPVLAALGLVASWTVPAEILLRPHLQSGLPLAGALSAAWHQSLLAAAQFASTVAPATALTGYVLWASWATGVVATAAYLLAFRARSAGAVLPPLALFASCCALGAPAGRYWASGATVAVCAAFLWAHKGPDAGAGRPVHAPTTVSQLTDGTRRRPMAAMLIATAGMLACLGTIPALGPEGSGPAGWDHRPPGTRLTPNPLVSMQADLLSRSSLRAFEVSSPAPTYWRLTSLDYFDGTTWQASGSYASASGWLARSAAPPGAVQLEERFHIQHLGSPWLPVGFQPESVSGVAGATYDPASSSLLVPSPTSNGDSYTVVAEEDPALLSPALLGAAAPLSGGDDRAMSEFLALPPAVPASVGALARRLTAGEPTEYAKAKALEDLFHRPPFVYTLSPPAYGSGNDLAGFLFRTHAGYCQQYASAFAVLARLAGLPSRVAVGFSTGERVGTHEWEVTADDAHAWPEVWFPGVGWAPFEPTPSFSYPSTAGVPGATGVPGQRTGAAGGRGGGTTSASSTGPAAPQPSGELLPRTTRQGNIGHRPALSGPGATKEPSASAPWWGLPWWEALALSLVATAAGSLGLRSLKRRYPAALRHRHATSTGPGAGPGAAASTGSSARRDQAYARLLDACELSTGRLTAVGLGPRPGETPAEWAARTAANFSPGPDPSALGDLVDALYSVAYGGPVPTDERIASLERAASWNWREYRRHLPRRQRVAVAVNRRGNRRWAAGAARRRRSAPTSRSPLGR